MKNSNKMINKNDAKDLARIMKQAKRELGITGKLGKKAT